MFEKRQGDIRFALSLVEMTEEVAEALVQLLRKTPVVELIMNSLLGMPRRFDVTAYLMDRLFTPGSVLIQSLSALNVSYLKDASVIKKLPNLSSIRVRDRAVNAAVLMSIADHPGLKRIALSYKCSPADVARFFAKVGDHGIIEYLKVNSSNLLGVDFARFFKSCKALGMVNFQQCYKKKDEEYMKLLRCLMYSRSITEFFVSMHPSRHPKNAFLTTEELVSFTRGHPSLVYFSVPTAQSDYWVLSAQLRRNLCWRTRLLVFLLSYKMLPVDIVRCLQGYLLDNE